MEQIRKQIVSFNLSLPYVGVVIYEKIVNDFTHYFTNNSYYQRYLKITTL